MREVRPGGPGVRKDRAPTFVRQAELAALNGALSSQARRGALVVVRGPTGSGKSTLLEAAARGWRAAGVPVIRGRFERPQEDAGAAAALGFPAIIEALREHFEALGDPRLAGLLAAFSRACAGASDDTAAGLVVALGTVFDSIGAARTVALLLDDADATAAPVLALTGARRPGCLVVVTCRDGRTPAGRQLEAAADLLIDLADLSEDTVGALLAPAGGVPVDDAVLPALRAALGPLVGNPGTVLATIDGLRRWERLSVVRGRLCLTDPCAPVALPEDHWLVTRVTGLGPQAVAVATMAAVSPLRIGDLPMLAEAHCAELAGYGRITDRLVEAGALTTDARGGIHLRCPALGARLVADAGPVAVARLHRAFAEALFRRLGRGDKADRARLADHVTSAGREMPQDERTAVWLAEVAAGASHDPDRAANWLRAALWHAGSGRQAGLIFSRLLRLLVRTGQYRRLAEVVDATTIADPGRILLDRDQRVDITAAAVLAAMHLGSPTVENSRAPIGQDRAGSTAAGALDGAVGTVAGGAGRAAGTEEPLLTAADLGLVTWALRMERPKLEPDAPRRLAEREDRLLAAGSLGDMVTVFGLVLGARYGSPVDGVLAAYQRMARCYAGGEFSEVLSAGREIEIGGVGGTVANRLSLLIAADTHSLQGDLDQALACLAAVPDEPPYVAMRAWVACGLAGRVADDPAAAIRNGWCAYSRQRAGGYRIGIEQLLVRMAETAVSNGQSKWAGEVLALVESLGHATKDSQLSRETVGLVRATVRGTPAAAWAALELARRRGHRLAFVQACLAIARRATDAEPWLREAFDVAKVWDAPYLRSQISVLMRERGMSAPRTREPRGVLSVVDARIVELIRDGRTNRQIATHLRISEKTVEKSLTRLFARTGLRSRVELAAAMVGGDLLRATS